MKRLASSNSVLNPLSAKSPAIMTKFGFKPLTSFIAVVSLSRRNCSASARCMSEI